MIAERLKEIRMELPPDVKLVAVSKFKPVEDILEAYEAGQRAFAESRPQELAAKAEVLPDDIEWHFIGHLQTNKIKLILPYVNLIQSVDSIHLLEELDRQASVLDRTVDCLLEVHISGEESKQGFAPSEIAQVVEECRRFRHINIKGFMGMASLSGDENLIHSEFKALRQLADRFGNAGLGIVSMGMTSDYRIAVQEGTNLVRIGTAIFGNRI